MIYIKRILFLILLIIVNILVMLSMPIIILLTPIVYCFNYILNGDNAHPGDFIGYIEKCYDRIKEYIDKIKP